MSKSLTMPVNCNQKENPGTWVYDSGCALCCGVDLASYFDDTNYTVADFKAKGLYSESGYLFGTPNGYVFDEDSTLQLSEADTIKRIKQYIDDDQPVICHAVGSGSHEHWTVAYKYTDGTTWSDIYVLDPAGTKYASSGALRTMQESMKYNSVTLGVDRLKAKTVL